MKPHILYIIYIFICAGMLASCRDSSVDSSLDAADAYMHEGRYDTAYAVLQTIDAAKLRTGSAEQARYALLYTQAQYKNYEDAPDDSLITLAVDYYEAHGSEADKFYAYMYQGIVRSIIGHNNAASSSLLRAMANSDAVQDHYSLGQMYSYLARVNNLLKCTDELVYAENACREYRLLGDDYYIVSAMYAVALANFRVRNFESCFAMTDSCAQLASAMRDSVTLINAIRLKADCALLCDSFSMSRNLYHQIATVFQVPLTTRDCANISYLYALRQEEDSSRYYLAMSRMLARTANDVTNYWSKALWVYKRLHDPERIIESQDSLLSYQEQMLVEGLSHTAMAEQRDYADWRKQQAEQVILHQTVTLYGLGASLVALLLVCLIIYKQKQIVVLQQLDTIKSLQLKVSKQNDAINDGLLALKANPFVQTIREKAEIQKGLTTAEWATLEELFTELLPHFLYSLRELIPMSDIECRTCMLVKLNCSPGDIAVLTNKSSSSVSSIRGRLYYKAFKKKGSATDWDAFILSI